MSVTIDLPPDLEADYAAEAAAHGVPLSEYLRRLLEERGAPPTENPRSPAERAAFWRGSAGGLAHTPLLSDEAISRESIYDPRG